MWPGIAGGHAVCGTVRFWSAAPNRFADAMSPPHDLGFGERFGAYLPLVTHARNEYPCVPVPVFSVLCLGTWRVSCGCAPWRPRRERWFKRWGRYRRQFTGTAATPLITHRRFLALWDRQWTLTLQPPCAMYSAVLSACTPERERERERDAKPRPPARSAGGLLPQRTRCGLARGTRWAEWTPTSLSPTP